MLQNTHYDAKTKDIECKITSITFLATTAAFTAVENKIPDDSDTVKKAEYDGKIKYIESKYFTTSDYSKFTDHAFGAKIENKELVNKSDISGFINNSDLNKKIKNKQQKRNYKQRYMK